MRSLKFLRAWRVFLYVAILINVGALVLDALTGSVFIVGPVVMIAALVVTTHYHGRTIRRRDDLDRPRPDYSAIAAMEREVYGETFEHEGAPKYQRVVSGPHGHAERKRPVRYAKPVKPRKPTFEDDRRAMRALGEARRAAIARAGECGTCGYGYRPGDFGMCRECDQERREHRSNLRWERPS